MKNKRDSFLTRYLELRDEVEDKYGIKRPDPIAILVYYLHNFTEIKEPRAMRRLLDVPLDRILDRLCKMGFISLPEKPTKPLKTKLQQFVRDELPSFGSIEHKEKSDEEKLMDFVST
ncbi:MAG: hypothetical protein PHW62_00920 [Candidatus Ratteibacteria bacterium]|nr:hypothetical protein [Candidatus Ratteibacteria bacterium]